MGKSIKSKPIFNILKENYELNENKISSWISDECSLALREYLEEQKELSIVNSLSLTEDERNARYIRISTIKEILNLFESQNTEIED